MRQKLVSSTKRNIVLGILCLLAASVHAQTTVQLPPWVIQQFTYASNGLPLASGCVNVYTSGTTTPIAVYSDAAGTIPMSNPVILDNSGSAVMFIPAGVAVKFAVYSNGGVNCASGTLQRTIDGITASSASGGSSATSVTSATSNPATAGVIRLAKSDTVCWRNASNAANLCLSLDSSNNLTWGGISLFLTEGACPSGVSGEDGICADSTAHRFKMTNNAGSVDSIVGQASTDTLTNKTYDTGGTGNVFKIAGTQITAVTGSGSAVLGTSPTLNGAGLNGGVIINGGVSNSGTGFQHLRFTGCTITSGTCTATASWNASFADGSYTVACNSFDDTAHDPISVTIVSKSTGSFNYRLGFPTAGTNVSGFEVDCVGVHD